MPHSLPSALYTAEQVRELDRIAIQERGMPGIQLMKKAGRAVYHQINRRWPGLPVTVFCGAGNNGGDGYIVAGLAAQNRVPVQIVQVAAPEKLTGDAHRAYEYAVAAGVPMVPFSDCLDLQTDSRAGVVVDALLGTGLRGEVREPYAQAIRVINASELPVLAVDIPSGLSSDTGAAANVAVAANMTVTFIGLKQGLFTGRGPELCGELVYDNLAVPADIFVGVPYRAMRLGLQGMMPRSRDAHKGDFGHVMVIGGDHGFGGATAMAAEAALRTGAGLVSVATRPEHVSAILARRPELMVKGVTSGQELVPLLNAPTVLVIGPGLGRSPWSEQMLQQAVSTGLPMVVDADALNIISQDRVIPHPGGENWVMTPHPGEAARLLNISNAEVQADRFSAVRALHKKFKAAVVLKGAGSLVCTSQGSPVGVCDAGNPGMASGGMGDVLSGIVGALLAQGLHSDIALPMAVCLHAEAADMAAANGERGLLATDLFDPLRQLVNG